MHNRFFVCLRGGVLVLVVSAFTVACTGASKPQPTRSTAPHNPSSAAADPRAEAVLAGYEAYWTAVLHASSPPSPGDAGLAQHAAGDALTEITKALTTQKRLNISVSGTYVHRDSVSAIDSSTSTVVDCLTMNLKSSGGPIAASASPVARPLIPMRASMILQNGAWKVSKLSGEAPTCSAGTPHSAPTPSPVHTPAPRS